MITIGLIDVGLIDVGLIDVGLIDDDDDDDDVLKNRMVSNCASHDDCIDEALS